MSINHPVTRPDQMRKPLVWNPISDEWRNGLVESKTWWCKEVIPQPSSDREKRAMDSALRLRDKLLSFGGDEACMVLYDQDEPNIMERGQLFVGTGIKYRKGLPSQCHYNSSLLWEANKGRCQIATGYALSEDGMWRQHTWVVQPMTVKYRIWETTVGRIAYFGFILTDEECEEFFRENT